ncbi:MAG: RNA polymerase sporulation sigma factor SigF [Lachnospiraceae bacterium]|nr:RNA polymerase sporulation sigma factor SigF [Lachnospiraceae bacterium]
MENIALIELAHKGDKEARDRLVQENMGLIWSIVRRFGNRGYEQEDLFQIGCIGLIKAIDKFDNAFEVKFSTYAVPLIMGEIKRFMRDDGLIKVSRSVKENSWKIRRTSLEMAQSLGREPTIEEISREMEISVQDIVVAMESLTEVESIYRSVYQSDGSEVYLIDKISNEKAGEEQTEKILNNLLLEQVISGLDDNEKNLLNLRYFQNKTQTEVAKRLGISQVQVSRLEKKLLCKMRKEMIS